jgi:hypothetical protein
MAKQLCPDGVFSMWSQNWSDENFVALPISVVEEVKSHIVSFYNPFQHKESTNTVYVCKYTRSVWYLGSHINAFLPKLRRLKAPTVGDGPCPPWTGGTLKMQPHFSSVTNQKSCTLHT